jgi:hypothetical protein
LYSFKALLSIKRGFECRNIICIVKANYNPVQKITFSFPDNKSMWEFKNQTQAINVAITPKKHLISGLFSEQEVSLALSKFNAVVLDNTTSYAVADESEFNKAGASWLKNYSMNYSLSLKKLKRVMASIHLLKPF